ncbi:DUF2157 domain-containing protein [Neobacillus massiliamazoniensis]|uniref:DUF2157 domain-containing protein n=1 Tax=Neobacillus massiliamazoniensis TaxID=1499688 RepID=A0A0U1NWB5_9BACI|nr:DUF2157 domain-containing protein [Neobacillus massiliamazoniensis]CRK82324.1 hypothetical protein BN000_02247 [Neobacillus massiliamazoniensis]
MTRRILKEDELRFLKRELQYLVESKVLPAGKAEEIEALYEVKGKVSFTKTLLYVGSFLIGAGILSFIASNWADIGKTVKFLLIIALFIGSNFAGFKLETNYPKTARSFYYIGVLVFGAGIFLIGQMFNFGGTFQNAFLWWSLGILPLAWVLRDKWILLASAIFVFMYLTDSPYLQGETIPYWILLWIAAIYVLNEKIGFSKATGFITGILLLTFIGNVLSFLMHGSHHDAYVYGLVYLAIGITLVLMGGKIRSIYVILGHLVHGGAALLLSFKDTWPVDWIYIPFSILYFLFVLYLIRRGSLLSIIILCVMIFRFYLDISFEFLPKSFVFIIGGFILLGFGFYFEKQRKKGGGVHE